MTDLGGEKLRAAFELSPTILTVTDLETGRIVEVNDAFLRVSGYDRHEVIGRTVPEVGLWMDPAQREAGLAALRAGQSIRGVEARFRTKSGEEVWAVASADVVEIDGRRRILTALMDITDRVRAETALREGERAKDEFLAMLGHELRNPLGTITNALGVLDRLIPDEGARRLLAIIGRQTSHLGRLVDDLLDVARVTSGKIDLRPQALDLRALAQGCLDALTQAGRTRHHMVTIEGPPLRVRGDPARLEQVINNLLDNALKYTPTGGRVRVVIEPAGADAVLRVRDTGEGIRPDLVDRIFDLFVQEPQALDRTRGGLGLGLSLVKRLVELHGGSVSAASDGPGLGSEFAIRLPAVAGAGALTPAAAAKPLAAAAARPRRVLVVEDNADARESLSLLLRLSGHEVETSVDAPDGLAKLAAFQPDVMLIDVGLPGMDGYDLARRVRARPEARDVGLIALTGYGQAEDRRQALAAGFDVHLTKPVDPERLEKVLARGAEG